MQEQEGQGEVETRRSAAQVNKTRRPTPDAAAGRRKTTRRGTEKIFYISAVRRAQALIDDVYY